jgi:hypothetical protein
LGSIHPI